MAAILSILTEIASCELYLPYTGNGAGDKARPWHADEACLKCANDQITHVFFADRQQRLIAAVFTTPHNRQTYGFLIKR